MAKFNWITADKGIRYREHDTKKHGIRPDRYFTLRYYLDGKRMEEALGWASDGWTLERARTELVKLKEAHRLGQETATLRTAREKASSHRKQQEELKCKTAQEEMSFDTFWNDFYLPYAKQSKSSKSVKTELGLYKNWIVPNIGHLPFKNIKYQHIQAILQLAQEAEKSARTIEYIFATISLVWNLAKINGFVETESPTKQVKKPKQDNRRLRFLTKQEAIMLLENLSLKSIDTHDMAILSLFGGLRFGEIQALHWSDINFEAKNISIRDPKNKKNRFCYMNDEILAVMTRRYNEQRNDTLIFPTKDGRQRGFLSNTFTRAIQELKFNENITDSRQKIVFHSLRHTFASWLVQKGIPLYTVAQLMGHSSLEMTQRYAHLAPDNIMAAALTLDGELSIKKDNSDD